MHIEVGHILVDVHRIDSVKADMRNYAEELCKHQAGKHQGTDDSRVKADPHTMQQGNGDQDNGVNPGKRGLNTAETVHRDRDEKDINECREIDPVSEPFSPDYPDEGKEVADERNAEQDQD